MKSNMFLRTAAVALLSSTLAVTALAQVGVGGRQLDAIGATEPGTVPVPSVGGLEFGVAPINGIFWDTRCASVEYTFNSFQGPNFDFGAEIPVEDAVTAVQDGLDRWNDNPSSFIEMNVTNITDLGDRPRGFDFINEVTFITAPGFGALASSPSTSLPADSTFAVGDDIDGDGDSDVFDPVEAGINTCHDFDEDGDIEFPAGDYLAGTILENDVQFGEGVFWELEPTDTGLADIDAVSTHEFGHSHGLNHALNNQISATDGTGTTMFPFIDTTDAASEFGSRSLHVDDLAASAFIYPEGSTEEGLPALQDSDVAFDEAYNLVSGTVVSSSGQPIAGAHVQMVDIATGEALTEAYSGTTVVFDDVNGFGGGGFFAFNEAVLDGNFVVPVPADVPAFRAVVQMLDDDPAATGNISLNAIIGGIVHGTDFPEEDYSGPLESANELPINLTSPVLTASGDASGIDFILNDEFVLTNLDAIAFGTSGFFMGSTEFTQVQGFEAQTVVDLIGSGLAPTQIAIHTGPFDASLVPEFDRVRLVVGSQDVSGDLVIERVIQNFNNVEAQDGDHVLIDIRAFRRIRRILERELADNPDVELMVIAETTTGEIGPSGFAAELIPLSGTDGLPGTAFISNNGDTPFAVGFFTFDIELRFTAR